MLEHSMFERLPQRSQTDPLAKDGVVLAQRRYNGWLVTLYSFNGSYVELWEGKDAQVISTFKQSAKAVEVLEPYLDQVDVQEFLSSQL